MEQRVVELEMKLVFQEDTLQSLSDTVALQQRQIERLQADIRVLTERLRSLGEAQVTEQGHERPPHY